MDSTTIFEVAGLQVTLAMFVAVLALLLTCYQAWQTHKHNRLSLRPILHWESDRKRTDNVLLVDFYLKNHGLGPALISEVKLTLDGKEVSLETPDPIAGVVHEMVGAHFSHQVLAQHVPSPKTVMRPHEEIRIASVNFHHLPNNQEAFMFKLFERVRLLIYYESIYGVRDYYDTDEKYPLPLWSRLKRPFKAYFRVA